VVAQVEALAPLAAARATKAMRAAARAESRDGTTKMIRDVPKRELRET
jgi:hypothetical protein